MRISDRIFGPAMLAAALGSMALAAGCGNDPARVEGTQMALKTALEVKDSVLPGKPEGPVAKSQASNPDGMALKAMEISQGAVIVAQIEATGTHAAMGEYGRNGTALTFATAQRTTLTIDRGIVVATRGFGDDLMSSEPDAAARLIFARQAGEADRVWRYLDGESIERPLPMTCVIRPGEARQITFAGSSHATRKVSETCETGPLAVENVYWVDQGGKIILSRQWVGPNMGYVSIQFARD